MILLIDYQMGNLRSVAKALEKVGAAVTVSEKPVPLSGITGVVLPGVGHFGAAMRNLRAAGWVQFLNEARTRQTPYLGLCLGLQVLYEASEEAPGEAGLGFLPGTVTRFPDFKAQGLKLPVPHMGWNRVATKPDPLWADVPADSFFYFVHSYYAPLGDATIGTCAYGLPFSAAVAAGSFRGCQFHPEKSQALGLRVLQNFYERVVGSNAHLSGS